MNVSEILKLIKLKSKNCEEVLTIENEELDFLKEFYKNNRLNGIDGLLTMDLTDFVKSYFMTYITNENREEVFEFINESVSAISGIINDTSDSQLEAILDVCELLRHHDMLLIARDLFADPNKRRSKFNLRRILVEKALDRDLVDLLSHLSEQENCDVAVLLNLYVKLEDAFMDALSIVHDVKTLRDDYEQFNEALEIYGAKNKEKKFLIQSFKSDFDITEINNDFQYMREHYESLSKKDATKRKNANKELGLYRNLEQKILQAIQGEEITDINRLLAKINDEEIRLAILKLVYEHNREYYERLISEYNELSKNSNIHYQRVLSENNINIDEQTIMHNSVEEVKEIISKLKSVGILVPDVIGTILQITDIETFNTIIPYFQNSILTPYIVSINPAIFNKNSEEYKNFLINIKMLKDKSINPYNFEISQLIFISDPSIVQMNIELLKSYSFDKSIIKGLDYTFLVNPNLMSIIDKMLELGLEQFIEEDLSLLNYSKNLDRLLILKTLNIPIDTIDELRSVLTNSTFIVGDTEISKYLTPIDRESVKEEEIPNDINRLKQYENDRVYNINGVILSKNRIKRNYFEYKGEGNRLLYSILYDTIMSQKEYETVKQSLTNSLTYK